MFNLNGYPTQQVSDTRTIVLGQDGRTDVMGTLYTFGSAGSRLAAAKALMSAARALFTSAKELHAQGMHDAGNGLRDEASDLIERALWMAPDGSTVVVAGKVWTLEGFGGNHVIATRSVEGRHGLMSEFLNVDIEDID